MTPEHQTAIDLMNEVDSTFARTTDKNEQALALDRLIRYLVDNFPAPKRPKDSTELEHWSDTYGKDACRVLRMSEEQLATAVLTSPELELQLPPSFAIAVLKVCIKGKLVDDLPIPSFLDFYRRHGPIILEAHWLMRQ
jgi:hypothetical protein